MCTHAGPRSLGAYQPRDYSMGPAWPKQPVDRAEKVPKIWGPDNLLEGSECREETHVLGISLSKYTG